MLDSMQILHGSFQSFLGMIFPLRNTLNLTEQEKKRERKATSHGNSKREMEGKITKLVEIHYLSPIDNVRAREYFISISYYSRNPLQHKM